MGTSNAMTQRLDKAQIRAVRRPPNGPPERLYASRPAPSEPSRRDDELLWLAAEAARAIDARVTRGDRAEQAVVEVIRAVFGALADIGTVNRLVGMVLAIIGERES